MNSKHYTLVMAGLIIMTYLVGVMMGSFRALDQIIKMMLLGSILVLFGDKIRRYYRER